MAVQLASAYINLSVRYSDAMSQIVRDVAGIEKTAKTSGLKAGRNLSEGIDKGSSDAGRRVASNVEGGLGVSTGRRIGAQFGNAIASQIESAMAKASDRSGKKFFQTLETSGAVGKSVTGLTKYAAAAGLAATAIGSLGPGTAALAAGLAAVGGAAGGAAIAGLSSLGVAVASIKVATAGLEDTFKLAFDPEKVEEFNKALSKLGPQTQNMVKGAVGLAQAWKDSGAQIAVQDALFAGVGDRLSQLTQYINPVRDAMVQVNSAFNRSITTALDFTNSAQGVALIGTWLRESSNMASNFASALGNLVPGLAALGTAATQVFAPMTTGLADSAKRFSDMLLQMQQTGELQSMFQRMADVAKQFGAALQQVGGIIAAVFSAASAAGAGNAFAGITDRLRDLNTFLSQGEGRQALITFFQSSQAAIGALLPAVMQLASVIGSTLAPIISQVVQTIGPALAPAIAALGQGFAAAAPQFEFLAGAVASFIGAITPLLPTLVQFAPALLVVIGAIKLYAAGVVIANAATIAVTIAQKAWMVATKAMAAAQWLLNAALTANPIGLIVVAIAALVAAVVLAYKNSETFRTIVQAAWEAIKTAISTAWSLIQTVFNAFKGAISVLGDVFRAVFNDFIAPMWHNLGVLVQAAWSIIAPIWEAFKAGISAIGDAFSTVFSAVFTPVWEGIKSVFQTGWDFLSGIFESLKGGFQSVADFVGGVWNGLSGIVRSALDGVVSAIRPALHTIGDMLASVPESLGPIQIPGAGTARALGAKLQSFRTGGEVTGPGTGTSDSILAWLSNGEGVVTAQAMDNGGATLVAALNAGWVPPVEMVRSMVGSLPGFAEGLNPGADFLRSQIMQMWPSITSIGGRRSEDGYGEHSSGNAIDVMIPKYDTPEGKALGDSVASFVAKNRDALGANGMIWRQTSYGYGGSFDAGKPMGDRGSDTQNHMDHVHIILGKGRGAGAPAVDAPTMSLSMPSGGSVTPNSSGFSVGGGGGGGATAAQLSTAQDKVTDLTNKLNTSRMALDEAKANPDTKGSTLQTKQDAVDKNQRELDQATTALETLKKQGAAGGTGAQGSTGSDPFSKIFDGIGQLGDLAKGGIIESFLPPGFDNPLEGSLFKSGAAILGFVGSLTQDPTTKSILGIASQAMGGSPSGVATGIGSLLSQPFGNASTTMQPTDFAAAPHNGSGALPGPGNFVAGAVPDVNAGGANGQTINNDNSVHVAEGGSIGTDPVKLMDKTQRQQVAQQNPQLGTRRFI